MLRLELLDFEMREMRSQNIPHVCSHEQVRQQSHNHTIDFDLVPRNDGGIDEHNLLNPCGRSSERTERTFCNFKRLLGQRALRCIFSAGDPRSSIAGQSRFFKADATCLVRRWSYSS
jgi:hypothetical protein